VDGTVNRPITTGNQKDFSPRWSPDGKRILYKSTLDGSAQLYMRWMDTGAERKLTNLKKSFGSPKWSPDGQQIAFSMFVEDKPEPLVHLPSPPKNATWAPAPKYIDQMNYRADGEGYLQEGYSQLFILSTDGGTPRQLTTGQFHHDGDFTWSNDSQSILLSANRHENAELDPLNSEIYELSVRDLTIRSITSRQGPDFSPRVSPDGKTICYLGFEDRYQGYQLTNLYLMNRDGSSSRQVIKMLDRDIENIQWSSDGKGIYFQYDDKGNTWIAYTDLQGNVSNLANNVGGLTLDRPYGGGQFTVASTGHYAFTHSTPDHPADLATGQKQNSNITRITNVNQDLFQQKPPGNVEEIWYTSSYDNRDIQGWIIYPPDFDAAKKYPFILEIHGGPFANYGSRLQPNYSFLQLKGT
jgi:acylaminoacyl-peptidase